MAPEVLRSFARTHYADLDLFGGFQAEIDTVLDRLILERLFEGVQADFDAWKQATPEVARVLWEAKTERQKLSTFAEDFFRRLAYQLGGQMLLKKGELHRLIALVPPQSLAPEVHEKLDLLYDLFSTAIPSEETP